MPPPPKKKKNTSKKKDIFQTTNPTYSEVSLEGDTTVFFLFFGGLMWEYPIFFFHVLNTFIFFLYYSSRHCGRVLCNKCSSKMVPIVKYDLTKPVRTCDICFDVLSLGVVS